MNRTRNIRNIKGFCSEEGVGINKITLANRKLAREKKENEYNIKLDYNIKGVNNKESAREIKKNRT